MLMDSQTDGKCWVGGARGARGKVQPIQRAGPRLWEMSNDHGTAEEQCLLAKPQRNCFERSTLRSVAGFFPL